MRVRVVCGLCVTIASFWPSNAFSKRGLAGVGTADDGDETGAKGHSFYYAPVPDEAHSSQDRDEWAT